MRRVGLGLRTSAKVSAALKAEYARIDILAERQAAKLRLKQNSQEVKVAA